MALTRVFGVLITVDTDDSGVWAEVDHRSRDRGWGWIAGAAWVLNGLCSDPTAAVEMLPVMLSPSHVCLSSVCLC